MGAIVNGLMLSGFRAYGAGFFIFSDYMKASIRLAAIMRIPSTFVFTHDSIGVGEDGPTHQPIEQLAALRATPNINVVRPAGFNETALAWRFALSATETPTALALSRQGVPVWDPAGVPRDAIERGAYVLRDSDGEPDLILMGSGTEVHIAHDALKLLEDEGVKVRLVSMPCLDRFEAQDQAYRDSVLPPSVTARVAVEAASPLGWHRWVGDRGAVVAMTTFGASAPAGALYKHFGFTGENVADVARGVLGSKQERSQCANLKGPGPFRFAVHHPFIASRRDALASPPNRCGSRESTSGRLDEQSSVHGRGAGPLPARSRTRAHAAQVTVATYNIHHAEGVDGRLDLPRIANELKKTKADVIGLQEVDRHFGVRSEFVDQAQRLAKRLDMDVVYGANLDLEPLQPGPAAPPVRHGDPVEVPDHRRSRNTLLPRPENGEQRGLLEAVVQGRHGRGCGSRTRTCSTPAPSSARRRSRGSSSCWARRRSRRCSSATSTPSRRRPSCSRCSRASTTPGRSAASATAFTIPAEAPTAGSTTCSSHRTSTSTRRRCARRSRPTTCRSRAKLTIVKRSTRACWPRRPSRPPRETEAKLAFTASAPDTDWSRRGREAAVVTVLRGRRARPRTSSSTRARASSPTRSRSVASDAGRHKVSLRAQPPHARRPRSGRSTCAT